MQVPQASLVVSHTMSNGIQLPSLDAKFGRSDMVALARDGNSLVTNAHLSMPDVSPDRVVLRVDSLLDGVAWLAGQSKSRQGRSNIPPCSACTVATPETAMPGSSPGCQKHAALYQAYMNHRTAEAGLWSPCTRSVSHAETQDTP